MNSKAITKIQAILLVTIIIVAVVAGAAYVLLSGQEQSSDAIRIGVCADLDQPGGKSVWQAAVLAAEQVNAEGGVLGRNLTIVAQDDDTELGGDPEVATNAFNKLLFVDEADFVMANFGVPSSTVYQDIAADNKKILLLLGSWEDELTQRVLDDYDKYKYFFRSGIANMTSAVEGIVESVCVCRNYTGFNKVAVAYHVVFGESSSAVVDSLRENGFDVVLYEPIAMGTIDFSSCFAKAEAAGAEIVYPFIFGQAGIPFVTEYYDRQSPMVLWGAVFQASDQNFWQLTGGKCEHITTNGYPVVAGYPLTSKTVSTHDAYYERWDEAITSLAAAAYDTVRFILVDAIERAGTIETEAVVEALEETDVETSLARRFVFTDSHDVMVGEAGPNRSGEDYFLVCLFQWQDGVQVPVYPVEIMEEAEATYIYPEWEGPWD